MYNTNNTNIMNLLYVIICSLLLALPASYEPNHFAKALFVGAFVQSLAYMVVFNLLCKKLLILRKVVFVFLFILFTLETYTYVFFDSRFNPGMWTLVLQTSLQEIKEFFTVFFFKIEVLIAIISLSVVFICLWNVLFGIHKVFSVSRWCRYTVNILSVLFVILGFIIDKIPLPFDIGQNTINELALSINFFKEKRGELKTIEAMLDKIVISNSPSKDNAPIIVLVIGESFNKHHSSLYGYTLTTSPLMEAEQANGNLVVFNNAFTPTCATANAMRFIFSLKSCNIQGDVSCVLMPSVFKKAGFHVAYIDNQYTRSSGGVVDYSCGYFLNPEKINYSCFDYRNDKTYKFDGFFIEAEKNNLCKSPKSLNIIHMMGQHTDFVNRYPLQFSLFKESDIRRSYLNADQRQTVAEYDNATLYNDYVLKIILDYFRDSDAVVIYLSDHGERIYDDENLCFGRMYSSFHEKSMMLNVYEVPFVAWCSDSFIEKHSDLYDALKQSQQRKICTDDVSYLLFELAGVDFNYNSPSRSMINKDYISHKTIFE